MRTKKDKKEEENLPVTDEEEGVIEDIATKNKRAVVKEWLNLLTSYLTGKNGNTEINLLVLNPMLKETSKAIDIYFKENEEDERSK